MVLVFSLLALISIPVGVVLVVMGANDLEKSLGALAKVLDERYTRWDPRKSVPLPRSEAPAAEGAPAINPLLAGLNLPGGKQT